MTGWIALSVALVLNALANSLLKAGSVSLAGGVTRETLVAASTNPYLLGGVVLFALNILCYTYALSKIPLSLAYPAMVIGGLIIVTTAATFVFGESLSLIQIGGIACLGLGVLLLYL